MHKCIQDISAGKQQHGCRAAVLLCCCATACLSVGKQQHARPFSATPQQHARPLSSSPISPAHLAIPSSSPPLSSLDERSPVLVVGARLALRPRNTMRTPLGHIHTCHSLTDRGRTQTRHALTHRGARDAEGPRRARSARSTIGSEHAPRSSDTCDSHTVRRSQTHAPVCRAPPSLPRFRPCIEHDKG